MEPTARPSTARPEEFDEFDTLGREFDDELYDPSSDERTLALLGHLLPLIGFGFLAPLVIYLVKRNDSGFVADQAKEALNFQITLFLAFLACIPLMIVLIGFVLLPVIGLSAVVLGIIAAIKANDGEWYQYPFTLRLIK
ncbi:MAG: DUF4870 domain-containing protein [Bacteroidota bacterium]